MVLAAVACFAGIVPARAQSSPRQTTSLSDGWRFRFGDAPETVTAAGFDDSGWEQVSVPHTWNRVGEYALTRSPATNNKQGIGWYRLTYDAKPMAKGRRLYIDFAAVGNIADVWINGAHVGQHKGAFTRFRFDVTPQWKPGTKNLIVVRADNSKPAVGSSTEHVIPLAGDFFIHGGLYRGVQLIEANDVGIDLLDFGGPGVYVRAAPDVILPDHIKPCLVNVRLRNQSNQSVVAVMRLTVADRSGRVTETRDSKKLRLPPNSQFGGFLTFSSCVDGQRWETNQPVVHQAVIEVLVGKQVVDSVAQIFGIRDFKFEPNTGLTLNGKPLKLHGVSRHQDRLGKGWALSRADHAEDMAIMKEMGVNSVRMAHYPHADEWVDEADKAGMVVWAEVPYVTTPTLTGGEGDAETFANAEQQTRELIRQQYNHPSIAMWAAGNEVDAATLFGVSKEPVQPLKLLQHIAKIAREEDPSRATVFADCCEDVRLSTMAGVEQVDKGTEKLAGATDLIGYNRYYGWYYPQPLKAAEQLAAQMDKFHVKHPTLPISISEYGAGGAISQHSDNVLTGFVNAIGRPQPEEYESWVHEQSWPVIRDRPFIFGSFVWNMFDFASDLRNEGDSVDINTKGLVTFDRKTRKDAFYYYKAQWTTEPFIHLTGKRYVDRAYSVMDVKAYTNQPKALLSVNGSALVETPCPEGICIWKNVALRPGANKLMAAVPLNDRGMPVQIDDQATFIGPDSAKQGIRIDVGDNAGRLLGTLRFGSDNFVTGGMTAVLNQGGFGGRHAPTKTVTAPDPSLYDYWREGEAFSYAIPVPNGKWTVTIHSFEPRDASTAMMSVSANGRVALPAFSVKEAAGGSLRGVAKSFAVTVKGGRLTLDLSAIGGKAVVAAIELTK